jgi:hypothetical protein
MAKNGSDLSKVSEQRVERDARPEKPDTDNKRQVGRPPTRPPYEQYLRVSKTSK